MRRKRLPVGLAHAQPFAFCLFGKRRSRKSLPPRVREPQAIRLAEFRSEEKSGCRAADRIRGCLDGKLGLRTCPFLILELMPVDTDRIVKLGEKRSAQRRKAGRRSLMRREPLSIDFKFVAL